jgi:hypothetical protein
MNSGPRIAVIAVLALAAAAPRAEGMERFWALFYDGSQATAAAVDGEGWWSDQAMLAGHRLFGTGNPVRMFQDTTLNPSRRGPHVVLANGDVLPGQVMQFLPASDEEHLPARLLVVLAPPLVTADPRGLAVRADRVLRLVSAASEKISSEPGTLLPIHRAQVMTTAVHWTEDGVKALTQDGVLALPFQEIADLYVPKIDVMEAVLDDSRYPPLGPGAILGRLETVDGAVLTYHRRMTLVAVSQTPAKGSTNSGATAYLHLQPSWSLAAILAPVESVWRQSFRAAGEVPLSLLPATVLKQKAGFHQWSWRRNLNVEGGPLWSGHFTVDLGVGTHSYCEIAFQLPPHAQSFTTLLGLDGSVSRGACAVCKIYEDEVAGRALFTSGFLRGGEEPIPVGPLRVAAAKRLVLVTDFGDEGRPPGADPLDIGDHVDWLMPFVTFEESAEERLESLKRFLPGCETWDIDSSDVGRMSVLPSWDASHERWLPIIRQTEGSPLRLTRTVSDVSDANQRVEFVFAHVEQSPPPTVELRVDGMRLEPVAEKRGAGNTVQPGQLKMERAPRNGVANTQSGRNQKPGKNDPQQTPVPYEISTVRWDLPQLGERTVQLALSISFDKNPLGVRWHGLALKSVAKTLPPDHQPLPREMR